MSAPPAISAFTADLAKKSVHPPLDASKLGRSPNDFKSIQKSLKSLHDLLHQQSVKAIDHMAPNSLETELANPEKALANTERAVALSRFFAQTYKLLEIWPEWEKGMDEQGKVWETKGVMLSFMRWLGN
ncbi:MAG: hypothetical protein Q9168_006112 [Polycauliona sp. 1 TL-2023]